MKMYMWDELVSFSKKYNKIVISGCQRTGTTVFAYGLSKEINYEYVDESKFDVEDIEKFESIFYNKNNIVIQAPSMLHNMKKYENDCLIIIIHRSPIDVSNSMKKSNWYQNCGFNEYRKFVKDGVPRNPSSIYYAKMFFIDTISHIDTEYNEIKNTKYFISNRNDFFDKQITNSIKNVNDMKS